MSDFKEHSVSPYLVCANAVEAIEFYKKAFGAEQIVAIKTPTGGILHATLNLNGSSVMLTEKNTECKAVGPATLGGSPVSIHLIVDDIDATMQQAEQAGAKIVMPAEDMFWGDRFGCLQDPFGHSWSLATHIRAVSQEEAQRAANEMMGG